MNLVVVCGMVMHSMVIILLIKTIQKKIIFHWRCSAVFVWFFHFSVCSIAVPVANDVAKLACSLSCLPPEQYVVAV